MKTVLIIGMGRFGHHLTNNMISLGNEVMIVDKDESRLEDLTKLISNIKIGDCTNEDVLRSFGVANFDICFVCIGTNFQSSLEITSLLKELGAKYVISQATRDIHAKFLLKNGADEVIYPNRDSAEKLAIRVSNDNLYDYVELDNEYSIYEIPALRQWLGKTIKQTNVRAAFHVYIIGIKKEYKNNINSKRNDLKIIGITGSRGKSTTALMIHKYLKSSGYKSTLYSSVMVDSPASHLKKNEAYEVAVRDEESLISIIEEVGAYGAEYLVLEVNESSLEKGFLKDVPFDVRVLTNLNPKHNLEQYSEEQYVDLKKSFFKDIEDDCKCVFGFQDYSKELLDELLQLNSYPKFVCSSNYIATLKGLDKEKVKCLLTGLDADISGMKLKFNLNDDTYKMDTTLMMSHNAFNILVALTTLDVIGVLNVKKFESALNQLVIPGRAEVYRVNGRLIIVDSHLPAMLDCLKELKEQGKVNKIKVVVGSMGHGYKHWEERFKTQEFASQRKDVRKYAMSLLIGIADYVYLTESDSGKENPIDICNELEADLDGKVQSLIILDREEAIKQAVLDSEEGDVVFISGRGNRRILCNSETTFKLVKDSEVVENVIRELGW